MKTNWTTKPIQAKAWLIASVMTLASFCASAGMVIAGGYPLPYGIRLFFAFSIMTIPGMLWTHYAYSPQSKMTTRPIIRACIFVAILATSAGIAIWICCPC